MATWNMGEAKVSFDNTADTLVDFSTGIRTCALNVTRDSSQYGTLGGQFKSASIGKIMGSGSLMVVKDNSTSSAYYHLRERVLDSSHNNETITLQIDEPDGATGSLRRSMEIFITGDDGSADGNSGDVASATFSFITHGTISESVIAP